MTAKSIKHKFQSTKTDGSDSSKVSKTKWNDDHDFFLGGRDITGSTDSVVVGDAWCLLRYNRATAIAASINLGTAGVPVWARNLGVGDVTFTPSSGTINGASTLILKQNQAATIIFDGTNYDAIVTGIWTFNGRSGAVVPAAGDYDATQIYKQKYAQGRLTLTSGVAVTSSDVASATSIYYTPFLGDLVSIWDGTRFVTYQFTEVTLALDSTTGHANRQLSGNIYDIFLIDNSGTLRLVSYPWISGTSRGTGTDTTELQFLQGLWVNKNSMSTARYGSNSGDTLTVAANRGTYLGTAIMTANGATEDSMANRYLYNAYNQQPRRMRRYETTNTWSINTAGAFRQANANTANQLNFVLGLGGGLVKASAVGMVNQATAAGVPAIGIGLDSTTTNSAELFNYGGLDANGDFEILRAEYGDHPAIGKHFLAWLEFTTNGHTYSFYGVDTSSPIRWRNGIVGEVFA